LTESAFSSTGASGYQTKKYQFKFLCFPQRKDAGIVHSQTWENVILMSTQHHNGEVHDEREDKKPTIILHYNPTKGAVDNVDKLVRTYSCQRKSRRWPMIFFQNLLDIAAYNAAVVFFAVNPDFFKGKPQRRRLFLERLAMDMIAESVQNRKQFRPQEMLVPPRLPDRDTDITQQPMKRIRCALCPRSTDRKTVVKCSSCNNSICEEHLQKLCYPAFK
jgi:hypothetical protein